MVDFYTGTSDGLGCAQWAVAVPDPPIWGQALSPKSHFLPPNRGDAKKPFIFSPSFHLNQSFTDSGLSQGSGGP